MGTKWWKTLEIKGTYRYWEPNGDAYQLYYYDENGKGRTKKLDEAVYEKYIKGLKEGDRFKIMIKYTKTVRSKGLIPDIYSSMVRYD